MAYQMKKTLMASCMGVVATMAIALPAYATEGYFQHGSSARSKALGGAGAADTRDAAGIGINPAGIFKAGNQFQAAISVFNPERKFTGSGGPGFTPSGEVESGNSYFPVPSLAYTRQYNDQFAFGLAIIANGGMNTSYASDLSNPVCGSGPFPAPTGVFCGGKTGVDLNQMFIQPTFGYQPIEGFSIGLAPVLAIQRFEAYGLAAFGGVTVDPANLTNNGHDWSSGIGFKAGVEFDTGNGFRAGASYQPKITMDRFDKYRGLFADGGKFDVPSNWQVGVAVDVEENITVMADIRHVKYSDAPAVSNSSRIPNLFGNFGAAGFGWDDVTAYKLGVEWRQEAVTWRAGIAHNNNPINSDDVTLNTLAPGVMEWHFTGGLSYQVNDSHAFDFAVMYAPESSVSGIEVTPAGPNPGHFIELAMTQFEATFGWTWSFD